MYFAIAILNTNKTFMRINAFLSLAKLITKYPADYGIKKKIAVMSSSNMNSYIVQEPLISNYLRTCKNRN